MPPIPQFWYVREQTGSSFSNDKRVSLDSRLTRSPRRDLIGRSSNCAHIFLSTFLHSYSSQLFHSLLSQVFLRAVNPSELVILMHKQNQEDSGGVNDQF